MYFGPDEDINSMQAFDLSAYNFNSAFTFYGFGPDETYYFMVVSGAVSSDIVGGNSGSEDCGGFASSPDVAPVDISEMSRLINGEHPTNNNNSRDELTGINVWRITDTDQDFVLISELDGTPETL